IPDLDYLCRIIPNDRRICSVPCARSPHSEPAPHGPDSPLSRDFAFTLPYTPELSPAEHFFQALRRALEGQVYPPLQAKQGAPNPLLKAWHAAPARVCRL
ncbi:MAG: hypothetical protein OXC13_08530, partial [Caldilineaceae bacterium]|nr:hypothetical protein [Caldilineaceae bacterium]